MVQAGDYLEHDGSALLAKTYLTETRLSLLRQERATAINYDTEKSLEKDAIHYWNLEGKAMPRRVYLSRPEGSDSGAPTESGGGFSWLGTLGPSINKDTNIDL